MFLLLCTLKEQQASMNHMKPPSARVKRRSFHAPNLLQYRVRHWSDRGAALSQTSNLMCRSKCIRQQFNVLYLS